MQSIAFSAWGSDDDVDVRCRLRFNDLCAVQVDAFGVVANLPAFASDAALDLGVGLAAVLDLGMAFTSGTPLAFGVVPGGALAFGIVPGGGGRPGGGFGAVAVISSATSRKSPLGSWAMEKRNGARLLTQLVAASTPARTAPSAENSSAADMMLWCASST